MTPDSLTDLMLKRYVMIDIYPEQKFEVGEILYADGRGHVYIYEDKGRQRFYPENYPKLFREMGWWEKRQINEMPLYLKFNERSSFCKIGDDEEPEVHIVKRHFKISDSDEWRYSHSDCFISEWYNKSYSYMNFIPATNAEWVKSLKQK